MNKIKEYNSEVAMEMEKAKETPSKHTLEIILNGNYDEPKSQLKLFKERKPKYKKE